MRKLIAFIIGTLLLTACAIKDPEVKDAQKMPQGTGYYILTSDTTVKVFLYLRDKEKGRYVKAYLEMKLDTTVTSGNKKSKDNER